MQRIRFRSTWRVIGTRHRNAGSILHRHHCRRSNDDHDAMAECYWNSLESLGFTVGPKKEAGARILTTLLYGLQANGARRGLATLCIGGGEAIAIAVERLSS